MATRKLSQIAQAGSGPAAADFLVGVTAGNVDQLFRPSLTVGTTPIAGGTTGKFLVDVGGTLSEADAHFPEAPGNLNFYVATTGSDSSPDGTNPSTPFATIQRALTEAARYNWVFQFFPTINIADGTYPQSVAAVIEIGTFINLFLPIIFHGNAANPQNIVLADGFALQFGDGSVVLGGLSFTGVVIGSCINCIEGLISVSDPVIFNDNGQTPFFNEAHAFTFCNGTITLTGTNVNWFAFAQPGVIWFSRPTINLPATIHMNNAFFELGGTFGNNGIEVSGIIFGGPIITNSGGVTGTSVKCSLPPAVLKTQNGVIADIPGTNNATLTELFLTGFASSQGTSFRHKSGLPTTSDVPDGFWSIIKDTSGGGVYLAANDGGAIVKVQLV